MALSMMVFFNKLQKNPFVSQILEQEKKNNLSNHSVVPTSKIIKKKKKTSQNVIVKMRKIFRGQIMIFYLKFM